MLRPWVLQHQPWPSPSAWTKTRSLHGCRNLYLLILPSLSFSLSFSLSLLLLFLDRTDVCSPLLCLFPTQFRAKIDFSRKKKEKCLLCSHRHTTVIAGPTTCLIAHLLAPHDRAQSQHLSRRFFPLRQQLRVPSSCPESGLKWGFRNRGVGEIHPLPSYKLICTKEKSSLTNADSQKA